MYSTDTAASRKPQLFSPRGRSRVHARVRILLIALAVAAAGCGRTALEPIDPGTAAADAGATDRPMDLSMDLPAERMDAPPDMPPDLPMERPPDLAPDLPPDMSPDMPPSPADGPVCVPKTEVCNGVDDNCDGQVDEDQPSIPCPNGGSRFCVAGRYSECPRRCDVCVPGSKRTCITTFCTFWGNQTCADDGHSFGACKETPAPEVCRKIADRMMRSAELEQCCIDNNFCCVDEFDLNKNGDTTEMLGRCEAVVCEP